MKRIIALLCVLCLLSACGAKETAAPEPPAVVTEKQEKPPQTAETPPAEEAPRVPLLLEHAERLDETGALLHVPNETVEAGCENIFVFQDTLVVCKYRFNGEAMDTTLIMLDLWSGDKLREATVKNAETGEIQICGDKLVLCSNATGSITVLDAMLQTVAEYSVDDDWCNFYVSPDAETAYCFEVDAGLRIVDLASGQTETVLTQARSMFPNSRCGNFVSFGYTDAETQRNRTCVLDLAAGTIEEVPFADAAYRAARTDDLWLCDYGGTEDGYILGTKEAPVTFRAEGLPELLPEEAHLLISQYGTDGDCRKALYAADGSFLSACTLPDESCYFTGDLVWAEPYGGYFFIVIDEVGASQLRFWDIAAPVTGEALAAQPYEERRAPEAGDAVSPELYDRAAALSERYGVTLRIADQCDTEFTDYTVERSFNELLIGDALDKLETALSAYPDGFFKQLIYGDYREIEISLVGTLTRRDAEESEGGFTSFTAFVEHRGTCHLMVFDVGSTDSVEQTCYHEFSHIIDEKLAFDADLREDSRYSEETWAAFNPAEFEYAYAYQTLPENFYNDGCDAWFVDLYSRTYPTEDRARIIEYAMSGYDWYFAAGTPLHDKLAYYAACIRETFDTAGWEEVTAWERPLSG
ncbi:MAG: hypothetical protein IIY16_01805 [Oscillospiraceae bacterium]|nr:hypothetical protein [Oscillospiraceae bacterium]